MREVRPLIRNADSLDRLFLTRTGGIYSANGMTKKMSMVFARLGFHGKTCHSLRHHMATDMFKRGAALHEVQAVLRHRDVRSTMIYSHTSVADLRAIVNRRAV